MSVSDAVDDWIAGVGGRLSDRSDAEDCYAEVRRRYWKSEASEDFRRNGITSYTEDQLEQLGETLWRKSLSEMRTPCQE